MKDVRKFGQRLHNMGYCSNFADWLGVNTVMGQRVILVIAEFEG